MSTNFAGDKPKARIVKVDEHSNGQRVDNFLFKTLKGVPKERIYKALRSGEVRVNKGRVKASSRLGSGDEVRIPPIRTAAPPVVVAAKSAKVGALIESSIVFEDNALVAINKPSGVAVHGGSGQSVGVIEALRSTRPDARYLELVHRLDRDTSGCLLIAKKRSVLLALHTLMQRGRVKKDYWLVTKGRWKGGRRSIEAPLHKSTRSGERLVRISEGGKAARTLMRPVAKGDKASLIEARLMTGRTHQIRVHAASIDHPVAGDPKYGDKSFNGWCARMGLKRMFLHARLLEFTLEDRPYTVQAPLGEALQAFLETLKLT